MQSLISITSDIDAINLLQQYASREISLEGVKVEFINWPSINIKISGKDYNSSLKTSQLRAIIKLQEAIYYQYSILNGKNKDSLTSNEKRDLELNISISKGSTELITELANIFGHLSRTEPTVVGIIGIVAVAAIYGANSVAQKYFSFKEKELHEEDRKMDLIEHLAKDNRKLALMTGAAYQALDNLSRCAIDSDSIRINDVLALPEPKKKNERTQIENTKTVYKVGNFYDGKFRVIGLNQPNSKQYIFKFINEDGIKLQWNPSEEDISKRLHHEIKVAYSSKKLIYIGFEPNEIIRPKCYRVVVRSIFHPHEKPKSIQ